MKLINNHTAPITCERLGITSPVAPGEEIELDDKFCLRSRAEGWGNHEGLTRPSLIEMVCPQLVPATQAERERYQAQRVEDLSEVKAQNARDVADAKREQGEAGFHTGASRFSR